MSSISIGGMTIHQEGRSWYSIEATHLGRLYREEDSLGTIGRYGMADIVRFLELPGIDITSEYDEQHDRVVVRIAHPQLVLLDTWLDPVD